MKKFFFQWSPLWSWGHPLNFFSTSFENFSTMLQTVLKIWKNVFFHQNNHFQIIKTCFEKIFFQWSPLWSWGHPLNFFSDQFWKFFNYASNCFKIWKNVFFHQNNHFQTDKNMFWKNFFPMVPPLVLRSPLKFFFDQFWKFFNYASNCFKIWKNVFFHQNNHFQIIKTCFEKIFFQWSPLWSWGHPLNFFSVPVLKIFQLWLQMLSKYDKTFSFIKTIILKS